MKRLFTRWLLSTMFIIMGISTAWAQKSVLDESFASGMPSGWTAAGSYWKFSDGNAKFEALVQNGVDTLFSPLTSLSSLKNKPSVAITYSNTANGTKVNELKVLYRASNSASWSVLTTFDAATDGQVNWKGELPDGLANVQIALAGAYKEGVETRVYRLSIENKTEATTPPVFADFEDLTTTSVTLYWAGNASPQFEQYNLLVSSSPLIVFNEGADIADEVGTGLTDEFYSLTNLAPNTTYYVYLQYDCGDGDISPWADTTFTTPCSRINAPFVENFEGEFSSCIAVVKNGSAAAVSSEYAYNSTKAFKSYSAKSNYNYLILPEFNGNVKNFQVSFMAAALEGGDTYARTITIGVCTEPTEAAFTQVKTLTLPKGRQWESIIVSLKGYTGTGKYIAFRFGSEEKENRLFIDDIRVEAASACPKPMFVEVSEITPNSAKLQWVETGNATEWNLVLSTKPLADPEDLDPNVAKGEYAGSISAKPYVATGLEPNTKYYAYLQAACGSSEWTNAVEFKTAREVSYPYVEHFDRMYSDAYTDDKNAVPDGWVTDSRGMNPNFYYNYYLETYLPYVKTTYNHEQTAYVNASLRLAGTKKPASSTSAYYSSIAMTPAMPKAVKNMTVTFWAYSENGSCDVIIGVASTQTATPPDGQQQLGGNIITIDTVSVPLAAVWTKCVVDLKKYTGTGRYIVFYISSDNSTPTVYIDDITIDDTSDCSAVVGLSAAALNTNSVKATWSDNTSATKWKVKVSTTEIDPATENGNIVSSTTVTQKEYTKTGLLMGTKYYIYVSPDCGDFWESAEATTGVGIDVPYYTDFTITNPAYVTGYKANRGPEFWTLGSTGSAFNGTIGTQQYVPYLNTSGWSPKPDDQTTPYLYIYAPTTTTQQFPYAIMPELQNAAVKDLKLSFYIYTTGTNNCGTTADPWYNELKIGVISSPSDINKTDKFDNVAHVATIRCTASKAYEYKVVDMSAYTGSGKYIVFYADYGTKNNYSCIDNLSVTLASAPQKVTDITISDITQTSAKLNWTKNDNATKWNIKMFTSKPTDPDTDEAVKSLTVTSKPTTITGLSHSTQYYAYVQSVIGEEAGAWSSVNFYTECDTWAVPFFEGFESYETGANTLSPCYTQTANAQVSTESILNLSAENKVGGNAFKFNATSSVKTPTLVFPTFDKPINTLQLTMKANPYSDSYAGKGSYTEIGVMEAGDNFVKVGEFMFDQADKKNWQECYINFSSYAGPGGRIAIRCVYDAVNTTIHVGFDDIRIEELPACGRISSMTITGIDSVGATLSWTKGKNESAWNLKVSSKAMDDPDEETADGFDGRVTAQTKLLNTLDDNTTYYAYVQPVDEVQSCVGGWSRAFSFKTLCRKQAFPYMEDFESYTASSTTIPDCSTLSGEDQGHSYISTSKGTNNKSLCIQQKTKAHKNYFVFPALQIDSVKRLQLTMDVWIGTNASYIDQFEIGVMTDPNDPTTFKATHVESRAGQSAVISGLKYSFADYTGGDDGEFGTYIAIKPTDRLKASDNSVYGATTIYIDNVTIDYIETCPKPSNVQILTAEIGPDTAKIIWESTSKTSLHRVRVYSSAQANPDTDSPIAEATANDTVVVVRGLASTHTYYAFVRAECGENNFSRWSTASQFRTKCAEVTGLPYEEGFEAYAANVVPDCWTQIPGPKKSGPGSSSTQAFARTNAGAVAEGAMGLRIEGTSITTSTSNPPTFAYSNAAIITPRLDVDDLRDMTIYFDVKGSTEGASLKIDAVSEAVDGPEDVEYLLTLNNLPATWTKAFIKLSDYYTSAKQLQYIRFTNATDGKSVNIDNIVFTLEPNVVLPVANLLAKKVSHESVSFSFDEKTPGINAWQVAYVAAGGNIVNATTFGVDTTTVTISNLTPETSYDIYVRSENTEWIGPLTMTTSDIPAALPYSTGWEDDQENAKWKIYNVKTVQGAFYPNYFVLDDAANCGAAGSKALYITNDGSTYAYTQTSSDVWATRTFNFAEPGSYTVSFRVKVWGNQEVERDDAFWVQLMPAGATFKAASATLVDGSTRGMKSTGSTEKAFPLANKVQYLNNREWATITKVFDIHEAGEYIIALGWTNSGVGKPDMPLAVDSVIVDEYQCTASSNVEWVKRSGNEIILKWFGGRNKKFEYVVSQYAHLGNPAMIDDVDKAASGIVNNASQVTLNTLLPSTKYSFYVRTLCEADETDWIEFDFATPCMGEDLPYTENFAEVPECWLLNNNAQITKVTYRAEGASEEDAESWSILRLNQNGLAILPELNVPLTQVQVEIGAFNGFDAGTVILGTVDNSWTPSSFTEIAQFTPQEKITGSVNYAAAYTLEKFTKMLNLYQGTGKLLALKNTGATVINIKYMTLTQLPDCVQPQKVEMTGISEDRATVNWIAGTESAWEIQFGDSIIENVIENPYVLTGLEQGTDYTVAVRAVCDSEHKSEWSMPATFRSTCGVNSLPLLEDFSGLEKGKKAALRCWENKVCDQRIEEVFNGNASLIPNPSYKSASYSWKGNDYVSMGGSGQLLSIDNYYYTSSYAEYKYRWFISPQYAIEGAATLSFDARFCKGDGTKGASNARFFVAISTDNGATWKKTDAYNLTEQLDTVYSTHTISLEKYNNQNIRIAFYHEGLSSSVQPLLLIDNVRMNCAETYPYADNACQGVDYEGYGFSIAKEDLPIAGEDSTYYRFAANTGMGCDSTVALTLTTRVAKTQTVYETICQGETYNFGPYRLSEPSSNNPGGAPYYITGETKYGCDSTIYLYLTVNESDTTVVDPIVKLNTELPFTTADGLLTIAAGTPISTFDTIVKVSESGCSFKKYSVTINQCTESYPYSASICEHELSYTGYGFTIAKADMPNPGSDKEYTRHSMNAAGCDSVITLTLTVLQNETIPQTAEAFNNELPKVIDTYFTIPAGSLPDGEMSVSFDTIVSTGGCSFNRYQVTVNRCTRTYGYAATLCEHETSYSDDNFNIDAAELPIPGGSAKEYIRHILTAEGCDSVITLTMNRLINDTTDIEVAIQNTDLKPDYKKDDNYTVPAGTAVGADFYTTVSIPGDNCKFNRYHVTVTQCENAYPYAEQICEDADGYVGYGFNIAKADLPEPLKSKQYTRRNPNEEGCDSIITLTLTAKNDTTKIQNTVRIIDLPFIADGVTIVPAGASAGLQPEVVTQVGTCSFKRYVITVTACDTQTDETDAICENVTSYTGYGFTIPSTEYPALPAPGESEQYHRMVDHGFGCENITLTLTVTPNDTADINITKFNTELPYIVDAIYTIPATTTVGSHIEVLPNGNDCSYNRYNITIEQKTEEYKISDLVCEDVTNYTGNGFDIAQADMPAAGSYKMYERHGIKLDAVGVDSIVKLTLTVQKNDTLLVEDEVFNNELPYMVGNETVIAAGAATGLQPEVVLANDGAICSYTRYVITVNQCVRMAEVKDTVCAGEDAYAGYGFMIPSADYTALPAIGEVGVYERHETTAEGCDSVITLRLKVMPLDTITHDKVVVKNTELPYTIDANYTIEANTPLGEYDVVIPNPDKDCSYLRYIFDVEQCIEKYPYQASVCANTNYEGYGFHIAATELPKAGQSKSYTRSNKNEAGCDSLITLTLTAIAPDTVDVVKEVLNTELPFIVDGETIVPAGASIGQQPAVVIANGDCAYKRYLITVNQCTTSFAYEDNVCAGLNYANYGFAITTAEMPAPGESKDFTRSAKDAAGCDSLITLSLSVLENDTIDHLPAYEIYISDLPLTVEGIVITPEDIKPGNYVFVFKAEGDCLYDRYYVNVLDEERGIDYVTADVDFIEVYDALGRKIQTLRQGEGQNTLPIGVYMLRTTMTDGRVVNSKLFIK